MTISSDTVVVGGGAHGAAYVYGRNEGGKDNWGEVEKLPPADGKTLIGFGPSSISALPGGYAQNAPHVKQWSEAVAAGRLPVQRGLGITREDRLRRSVIERLLCDGAVDLRAVAARHDDEPTLLVDAFARLAPLIRDGLATVDGWQVAATPAGRRYWRTIAACFDPELAPFTGRHSVAV